MAELSLTMRECVEFMKTNEDQIHRHPGGFWSVRARLPNDGNRWFGTSTVEALVKRGYAEYDKYVGTDPFPVRATLIQPPQGSDRP